MATLVTRYVRLSADPGGNGVNDTDSSGDNTHAYDSLGTAISGEEGDISTGTGSDDELHIEITVGGLDSPASTLTLNNFTTDATGFLTIEATGSAHHQGVSRENGGTGYQVKRAGHVQDGGTDYYRLKGLEVTTSGTTFHAWDDTTGSGVGTTDKRFEECIFNATNGSHATYSLNLRDAQTITLTNVLCMSPAARAADLRDTTATVDHCGFVVAGPYGVMLDTGVTITNSYALTGSTEDFYQEANASSSHCASVDGSAPNTSEVTIIAGTNEFTNYTAVPSTADLTLKDNLLNEAGTGSLGTDITGGARTGTADIGPFNYDSGGASVTDVNYTAIGRGMNRGMSRKST